MDPAFFSAAGESLTSAGSDFADRLAAFQQQAAAYEGAWGDDTIGAYIGTAYAALSDWAFESWLTVADELGAAGEDLIDTGTAYQAIEDEVTSGLDAIAAKLG